MEVATVVNMVPSASVNHSFKQSETEKSLNTIAYQQTLVMRGVETISPCALTDPVQCMMRLMMLLLVILLSDVELFWKEHRISWGNFQMLLWTTHQTRFDKMCVHTMHGNLCAHKSEHSRRRGELLSHWWTRLQLGLAAKNP